MGTDIQRYGPDEYLRRRSVDDAVWSRFTDLVERADPAALALAAQLRRSADGGLAESLDIAVAQALPLAPEAVLRLSRAGFEVSRICTSPFIEPAAGVESRYVAAALRALDAMPNARRPHPVYEQCRAAMVALSSER